MRSRSSLPVALLAATLLVPSSSSCSRSEAHEEATTGVEITDAPLAEYQRDLLELAFKAVSKFPLEPHVKNRSRAQEKVVLACFELDQPERALGYAKQIENWRRGAGYADYALYRAQHGDRDVQQFLQLAAEVADESADVADAQEWRSDRIRAKIAQTYVWLRRDDDAAAFERELSDSEAGKADIVRAMRVDDVAFDDMLASLQGVLLAGSLDRVKNALAACTKLYDRFYDDEGRRARIEEKVRGTWQKVPAQVTIHATMSLARVAADHGDVPSATSLTDEAAGLVESVKWLPEDHVPMLARLADLRRRTGDEEAAREEADVALDIYDATRSKITNIWRAGALRPLAETYHGLGDDEKALAIYARVIEEGVENPNSRPRADDLAATCCSMAVNGVEPSPELWKRMIEICDALGDPW